MIFLIFNMNEIKTNSKIEWLTFLGLLINFNFCRSSLVREKDVSKEKPIFGRLRNINS